MGRRRDSFFDAKEAEILKAAKSGMTLQEIIDYVYSDNACDICLESLGAWLRKHGIRLKTYKGGGNRSGIQLRQCDKCSDCFRFDCSTSDKVRYGRACLLERKQITATITFSPVWCPKRFDTTY